MNYKDFYIGRLLNALSQLGNTVIGGNPDVSISARIGEYNYFYNSTFYRIVEKIVDFTFEPIDGKGHCRKAYLNDRYEDFTIGRGSEIGAFFMVIIVLIFCVPLALVFYLYKLIKTIS